MMKKITTVVVFVLACSIVFAQGVAVDAVVEVKSFERVIPRGSTTVGGWFQDLDDLIFGGDVLADSATVGAKISPTIGLTLRLDSETFPIEPYITAGIGGKAGFFKNSIIPAIVFEIGANVFPLRAIPWTAENLDLIDNVDLTKLVQLGVLWQSDNSLNDKIATRSAPMATLGSRVSFGGSSVFIKRNFDLTNKDDRLLVNNTHTSAGLSFPLSSLIGAFRGN